MGYCKDFFISPEALEDLRKWDLDRLDKESRKIIFEETSPVKSFGEQLGGKEKQLKRSQDIQDFASYVVANCEKASNTMKQVMEEDISDIRMYHNNVLVEPKKDLSREYLQKLVSNAWPTILKRVQNEILGAAQKGLVQTRFEIPINFIGKFNSFCKENGLTVKFDFNDDTVAYPQVSWGN
jgi:hypothetical protein